MPPKDKAPAGGVHTVALPLEAAAQLERLRVAVVTAERDYRNAVGAMALAHGFQAFAYDPATGTISVPAAPTEGA